MTNIISIILIFIFINGTVWAESAFKTYKITPAKKRIPNIEIIFLTIKERDFYLEKYFKNDIQSWDNFERDLLYKKILFYEKEKVLKKYSFLTDNKYNSIVNDFKTHPNHQSYYYPQKKSQTLFQNRLKK